MPQPAALVLREPRPRAAGGLAVSAALVALATVLIFPLREGVPVLSTGVVYLLAVVLVSSWWGLRLGLFTALLSAAAFNFFHIPPTGRFEIEHGANWLALGVFLVAAVIAGAVAELARRRTAEAELRRREADLAAQLARLMLSGTDLDATLEQAGGELARALDVPWARIATAEREAGPGEVALGLQSGERRLGTVLLPEQVPEGLRERLRERLIPSLSALLAATLDREALEAQLVESRALRRSDEIKTAVLRAVSHDLRSPLTAIVAAAEALDSPSATVEERHELARAVVEEAGRLSALVDKLLDMSRLQAGVAPPRRDWASLEEVVRAAVDGLGAPEGAVRVKVAPGLPLLEVDGAQVERALANLTENALRYSGGRPVQVRAGVVRERVVLRVVDAGPGIANEDADRIFEPFYRGAQAPGRHTGSGLGLAVARGLIEANDGTIAVESTPGQGATFVVTFPVTASEAGAPAEEPREGAGAR